MQPLVEVQISTKNFRNFSLIGFFDSNKGIPVLFVLSTSSWLPNVLKFSFTVSTVRKCPPRALHNGSMLEMMMRLQRLPRCGRILMCCSCLARFCQSCRSWASIRCNLQALFLRGKFWKNIHLMGVMPSQSLTWFTWKWHPGIGESFWKPFMFHVKLEECPQLPMLPRIGFQLHL